MNKLMLKYIYNILLDISEQLDNIAFHRYSLCHGTYVIWYLRIYCARKNNRSFRRRRIPICVCSRSTQMLLIDQITDIDPFVRTYSELPSNISTMTLCCQMLPVYTVISCVFFAPPKKEE